MTFIVISFKAVSTTIPIVLACSPRRISTLSPGWKAVDDLPSPALFPFNVAAIASSLTHLHHFDFGTCPTLQEWD